MVVRRKLKKPLRVGDRVKIINYWDNDFVGKIGTIIKTYKKDTPSWVLIKLDRNQGEVKFYRTDLKRIWW